MSSISRSYVSGTYRNLDVFFYAWGLMRRYQWCQGSGTSSTELVPKNCMSFVKCGRGKYLQAPRQVYI